MKGRILNVFCYAFFGVAAMVWRIEAVSIDFYNPMRNQFPIYTEHHSGRFLHITDIHIDPYYTFRSDPENKCHSASRKSLHNTAGKFGALHSECDTPYTLTNSTFDFLKKNFSDVDFVIYTGDTCRHERDPNLPLTKTDVLSSHRILVQWFTEYFDVQRVKIIPAIGNNDEFEHNQLTVGPNSLLSNLTEIWAPLRLNLTNDFYVGGYFRQDIDSQLSVLSLNSMYLYKSNLKIKDCKCKRSPGAKQLIWFETELKSAREENRKVYVSQHMAPLDSSGEPAYYPTCFKQYVQLIGDYSDVIYGHFTGHTNQDTLTFVSSRKDLREDYHLTLLTDEREYPSSDNKVVLVLNNAPSIIPVNNPAVREYYYSTDDQDFGVLLNYHQYFTNLTEANNLGEVRWYLEYTANDHFGIYRLQGGDWEKLFKRFKKPDLELWERYIKYIEVSRRH
ncbi:15858_t:CDS:2 [Acaulospora morrowiae]|uniref:15858_t:CDS:1 n=1 Tax=Acaulospora morrowiae TaxID=94023 RepID=A0A9N8ZI07_9GLOM|nr:15858_t:CDS:2 [Acaulospora morrowiae]